MTSLKDLQARLRREASPVKAKILMRFFKTGPGQYGEGDRFLGLVVPQQRKAAIDFQHLELTDIQVLLKSPFHEERLVGLFILTRHFKKSQGQQRKFLFEFYLQNTMYVNNWDLVDLTAYHIVGAYLEGKDKKPLFKLAKSKNMWERRIAMVACFHEIRRGQSEPAISIAQRLLDEKHDLMHKAVGWMLREVGKRVSRDALKQFLREHYAQMPRTALRYAIEHFPESERQAFLRGTFSAKN